MTMLLSLLIACGGNTTDNTEELVTTEATVTDEGIEVVETTTNEDGTTTTTTDNTGETTETTTNTTGTTTETTTNTTTGETTENTETTNDNEQFIGFAAPFKSRFFLWRTNERNSRWKLY